jgi:FdrA protein
VARAAGPGFLAGLFAGGTLAAEATELLLGATGGPNRADRDAGEVGRVGRHRIVDLGDDRFTRGKPHPIIDPTGRLAAVEQSVAEGASLLLLDFVLGHAAHPDPAGALAPLLARVRAAAGLRGARLEVLASVVGTDTDPQSASAQVAMLRQAGVRVYATPTGAARVAAAAAALLAAG